MNFLKYQMLFFLIYVCGMLDEIFWSGNNKIWSFVIKFVAFIIATELAIYISSKEQK